MAAKWNLNIYDKAVALSVSTLDQAVGFIWDSYVSAEF